MGIITNMANISPAPYRPDRVSPPGETIRDILEDTGMSQAELARRMGRPPNKVNQIIQGKKAITADTALELESVLGLPASFWLNREQNYQLALSAQAQRDTQQGNCEIAKTFPCAEMAKLGWIEKQTTWLEKYKELLRFFGTAQLNALNDAVALCPSFRKADGKEASKEALAAWMRKGLIESQKISRGDFSKQRIRESLESLRQLTNSGAAGLINELPNLAANLGLAVVFVPHLQKTYVGGAAYWYGDIPIIQLSYRWKRHDVMWFNFFHELGHILLHSRHETYLDDFSADQSKHEIEANAFATNTLIPAKAWDSFVESAQFTRKAVRQFSESVKISPSIVVGRLHREKSVNPRALREFQISITE